VEGGIRTSKYGRTENQTARLGSSMSWLATGRKDQAYKVSNSIYYYEFDIDSLEFMYRVFG